MVDKGKQKEEGLKAKKRTKRKRNKSEAIFGCTGTLEQVG